MRSMQGQEETHPYVQVVGLPEFGVDDQNEVPRAFCLHGRARIA